MNETTVLIVSNEPLLRLGLRQALNAEPLATRVCEASNAGQAIEAFTNVAPCLAIIAAGRAMVDSLGIIKDLHRAQSTLPILVIGLAHDEDHVQRALRAGARGYLTTLDGLEELKAAVAAIRAGSVFISQHAADGLLVSLLHPEMKRRDVDVSSLSDREMQVFMLVGRGHRSKEIAAQLGIGIKTVETHQQRIREKLHAPTSVAVQKLAASRRAG